MGELRYSWCNNYFPSEAGEWSRGFTPNPDFTGSPSLLVRHWGGNLERAVYLFASDLRSYRADYPADAELFPLARSCEFAQPVVDWLLENAHTPEQKALAAALERTLGAGVGR